MSLIRVLAALSLVAVAACGPPKKDPPERKAKPDAGETSLPAQGTEATLEVGNWNLNWFGDAANGPTDEVVQQRNVRDVLAGMDLDLYGLEEVVDVNAFTTLVSELSGYSGVLASDITVTDGASYYAYDEQKVALVWKTSMASLRGARLICTDAVNAFAGRPPLEVTLDVSVNGGAAQRLTVIVLHMKAFNDEASWQRRQEAGDALKQYLDANHATDSVLVIGDWNDDLDTSITPGKASPYAALVADTDDYAFPTRKLTDAHVGTTVRYQDAIDHQLVTNELAPHVVANSATVFDPSLYVAGYGTTTADHYPVYVKYTF